MTNTYKYSLIRVEPDNRRGERVNVGIVVFADSGLDIRVVETRKAIAIASKNWDAHMTMFASSLQDIYEVEADPKKLLTLLGGLDRQISLTDQGWFEATDSTAYETQVKKIIDTLVRRPRSPRKRNETSISSEIAASFRSADILSSQGETLESGKVVRNYVIDQEAGLDADFALQNGALHLATTISLTASNPHFGSAASKAITMDKAKKLDSITKAYCVYAVAPSRKSEVSEHISILGDYADDIFNWHERSEQEKFKRVFYDAYNSNFPKPM
jgi:hypothetical protein